MSEAQAATEMDWGAAEKQLQEVRRQYVEIGAPGVAALTIVLNPLVVRLARGERTRELYDDIMSTE